MISDLFKHSMKISAASLIASGITFLCLPILTRGYGPQKFEDFGVFISIVTIVASISSLRLNIAIPIAKKRKDFYGLILLSIIFSIIIPALFCLVFLPIISTYSVYQSFSDLHLSIFLLFLACFGMSLFNISLAIASREKKFSSIAISKLSRSFFSNGCQLILINISSLGLIIGYVVFCYVGFLSIFSKIYSYILISLKTRFSSIKETFNKFKHYPFFSVPEVLFFNLGTQLPIVLIAIYTDNAEAGFFFIAMRIISVPMLLLGQSISNVYLSYAPKESNIFDLKKLTIGTMKKLFFYAAMPLVVIGLAAPFYVSIIFGEEWQQVGYYTACLSIGSALQLVSSPVAVSLHVLNKQKLAMNVQFLLFIIRILPIWILLIISNKYFIEAFAFFNAISYLILMYIIISNLNRAQNSFKIKL